MNKLRPLKCSYVCRFLGLYIKLCVLLGILAFTSKTDQEQLCDVSSFPELGELMHK